MSQDTYLGSVMLGESAYMLKRGCGSQVLHNLYRKVGDDASALE